MRRIKNLNTGFTLIELLVVIALIGILSTLMIGNFMGSQQKSRDARRKSDLKQIGLALEAYYNDKGVYPADSAGQIAGCANGATCSWGASFEDENGTVYMVNIPKDPRSVANYFYDASINGDSYQIYTRLENTLDSQVPKDSNDDPQNYSGTDCGDKACNFGFSSSNTNPLEGRTLAND